jgi:hypothetical protein
MNDSRKARFGTSAILYALVGALALVGAGASSVLVGGSPQALPSSKIANSSAHLLTVGMVALLANPEHYEGTHVRTYAFMRVGRD